MFSHRKRIRKSGGSSSSGMASTSAVSASWEGKFDLQFAQDDIFAQKTDMVVMACNDQFQGTIINVISQRMGGDRWEAAVQQAHGQINKKKMRNGEVLFVELPQPFDARVAALVISPEALYIRMAYKTLMDTVVRRGFKTVTLPGLGCGACKVEPRQSASKLKTVLSEMKDFGQLQKMRIVDRNGQVINKFNDVLVGGESSVPPIPVDAGGDPIVASIMKLTHTPRQAAEDTCSVCMEHLNNGDPVVALNICDHQMHFECVVNFFKSPMAPKNCWVCKRYFALPEGNMPHGTMSVNVSASTHVPGFNDATGAIIINYSFSGGIQAANHLRPGQPFSGTHRTAYLPNNEKGNKVLALLRKAFDCKLTFTVGDSITSGATNTVVWNNVHHKTSLAGGSHGYGYPDAEYLDRVTEELAAAGVTEDM